MGSLVGLLPCLHYALKKFTTATGIIERIQGLFFFFKLHVLYIVFTPRPPPPRWFDNHFCGVSSLRNYLVVLKKKEIPFSLKNLKSPYTYILLTPQSLIWLLLLNFFSKSRVVALQLLTRVCELNNGHAQVYY